MFPGGGNADVGCPYPGLAPFAAEQAEWFFGRDRLTADLVNRLDACLSEGVPVMMVAASGAGKSSLLRAGLLPKVAAGALTPAGSRHWPRVVFTPGAHPMRAAATALLRALPAGSIASGPSNPQAGDLDYLLARAVAEARPGGRAVFVVDQFEELFRLCEREEERGAFISWLWRAARGEGPAGPRVLAACAVRADSYPDCMRYPQIRQALQGNQVIVGAMSAEELREAIICPAEAAGLDIEPGLTELLLADLRVGTSADGSGGLAADDGAGRLPLLAHALQVTWRARHGSTLTVDGYQAAGSIKYAVAATAERVFAPLDTAARDEARRLFLRLVKIGATTGEDVRRPVPRPALVNDSPSARAVIDAYTDARLLTQTREAVQITHETLLRAWPRLAGWLADDRAGQLTRQRTEDDAAEWHQAGDPSLLYRGARLETTAAWAGSHRPELSAVAWNFITASQRLARRGRRVQRAGITVLAVLLLIVSVTSAVAVIQRSTAVSQSRLARSDEEKAQSETRTAQSEAMAAEAVSLLPLDAPLGMLVGLQAYERAPTLQATSSVIEAAQEPLEGLLTTGSPVSSMAISPDGRTLAADEGTGISLWDVTTGRKTAAVGHGGTTESMTFSPDGHILAVSDYGGGISLYDASTGRKTTTALDQKGLQVTGTVAFSPDGRTLAAGSVGGGIVLWNVATGRVTATLNHGNPFLDFFDDFGSVAFSPDGRTLATDSSLDGITLWNVATGQETASLSGGDLFGLTLPSGPSVSPDLSGFFDEVAFSSDGRTLATLDDRGIRLWDVTTRRQSATLDKNNAVSSMAFSPDGRTLAAVDHSGIGLWDATTGRETATLDLGATAESVAFRTDGGTLAVGGTDGDISLWDVAGIQRASVIAGSPVRALAFSPDGRTLAVGDDGGIGLWDVTTGRETATFNQIADVSGVEFSPDGRTLAAVDGSDVSLWVVATGQRTVILDNNNDNTISGVAFSPDGRTLATADDGSIGLWDVTTGRETATFGENNAVSSVAFSPDGRTLAAADGRDVSLWDVAARQRTATLDKNNAAASVAFSPDGRTLAVGGAGGAGLWNLVTGREIAALDDSSQVDNVVYSPGSPVLTTGDSLRNVDFWDAGNGHLIADLPEADGGVNSLAFAPSGKVLAIGGENGSIVLLRQNLADLSLQFFTHLVCGKVRNNLTRAEWAEYAPGQAYQKTCP